MKQVSQNLKLHFNDGIHIIGRNQRDVCGVFVSIETEAAKMALAVNQDRTTNTDESGGTSQLTHITST